MEKDNPRLIQVLNLAESLGLNWNWDDEDKISVWVPEEEWLENVPDTSTKN